MKKTFILLSIVFMIVMALASLSFANKTTRNFNEMTSDPIITVGPPKVSIHGQTYTVRWNVPTCRNNQSRCVEGYEVMVDNKRNRVFRDATRPLSNSFTLVVNPTNVPVSTCLINAKHWIRVRAYNSYQEAYSQVYSFTTSNGRTINNSLVATVDNAACIPRVHIKGSFNDGTSSTIQSAKLRLSAKAFTPWNNRTYAIPTSKINGQNIDASIAVEGIDKTNYKAYIDIKTSSGCPYTQFLRNVTFDPIAPSLTCNPMQTDFWISSCGPKGNGAFRGLINDPNQCLDRERITYQVKIGSRDFASGNVDILDNQWDFYVSSIFLEGDLVETTITYYDKIGRKYQLECSDTTVPGHIDDFQAGPYTSVGICSNSLWMWGRNDYGQLGIGTRTGGYTPQVLDPQEVIHPGNLGWDFVSAGFASTIAIDCKGHLWSWGLNTNGQLGINSTDPWVTSPILIPNPYDQTVLAVRFRFASMGDVHVLAIDGSGGLWGWGDNITPRVGIPDQPINILRPQLVDNTLRWIDVAAAGNFSVGIAGNTDYTGTFQLYEWGNFHRASNWDFDETFAEPKLVPSTAGINFYKVSARGPTYAALTTRGDMYIYGQNVDGEDTWAYTPTLLPISNLEGVAYWQDVSVASDHILAIDNQGRLWGWGTDNYDDIFGCSISDPNYDPYEYSFRPKLINLPNNLNPWFRLGESQGELYSFAMDFLGDVWRWGKPFPGTDPDPNQDYCNGEQITFGTCN